MGFDKVWRYFWALQTHATELAVTGMNCAGCARHVTEALQSVPGVAAAQVSLAEGRARVRWKEGAAGPGATLVAAVHDAGYEATVLPDTASEADALKAKHSHNHAADEGWRRSVWLGIACTLPLMMGEWIFGWGDAGWFRWVGLVLASPVQVFSGARFYRGAWRQLKMGSSNMDTLVALGSTAAFGFSVWQLFSHRAGHCYFMEAAAIITLISLGHWMEARASAHAEKSLRALFQLAPPMARRRNADGSETDIPVSQLQAGEAVVLRPGDRIPADGTVKHGAGSVDEAMLTGESVPADKQEGAMLYAGTINLNGQMLMNVTGAGEATAVARIIAAVQRAQNSRADIQRLADRVSNVFVPIVVGVALATAVWWGFFPEMAQSVHAALARFLWEGPAPVAGVAAAVVSAVAVLVVACPCAMGLATPIAIMAGANAGARRGILIRDGVALEKAGRLTTIVFDKTGTLTQGRPIVAGFDVFQDGMRKTAGPLAAALARGSKHPLSRAIAALSPDESSFRQWREIPGGGLEGRLADEAIVRLGSLAWLERLGVVVSAAREAADRWMNEGATVVGLSIDANLAALIALRDAPKTGAPDVVARFRKQGLKMRLITGDSARTSHAVARQLGIPPAEVFAETRPEQKAALVRQLQESGERVAFVGDGINDAAALEQADLGIAVSRASDIAGEAADIVLLQSDIHVIPEAVDLARATLHTVKQNLFWAFFYNAAAIPLAALGFISPIVCAAAMGFSDLVVIGNALRLNRSLKTRRQ